MNDSVLVDRNERIAKITLNRPATRNALSRDLVDALVDALETADKDPEISCVILNGAGKGFSSGGNLAEIKKHDDRARHVRGGNH